MLDIARRWGTPVYVYDGEIVTARIGELLRHFKGAEFHYAIKANPNPSILKLIKAAGIGVEAVSPGELLLAGHVGFKKQKISFTSASATEEELVLAAKLAGTVHLDSLYQLDVWGRNNLGPSVSLRLNQGIGAGHHAHVITGGPDSKFGISLEDLPKAKALAAAYNLRITGIQQHIGSNVLDEKLFLRAVTLLLDTARMLPDVTRVDFGGGFGVPYDPNQKRLNMKSLGSLWKKETECFVKESGREVSFAFEPGRYIVAEAGTLLVSVTDIKETSKHRFVGVNSGFNHLVRHAMYGSYHHVVNLSQRRAKKTLVSIAGNICESGDLFAVDREIASPSVGDVLAIENAGAYGMSMSSLYNMRALPREILIVGGKPKDISFNKEALLSSLLAQNAG